MRRCRLPLAFMSLLAVPMLNLSMLAAPAAAQEADAGRRVFNQCRACHSIDAGGRNGVGPNLNGIVGRKAGIIEGFRYSANLKEKAEAGLVWDEPTLRAYVTNPKAILPNGSMSYPGLRNEQQLDDLLAFLKTQG